MFQKILYIPKPDHNTRVLMWKKCLELHEENFDREIDYGLLAKLSDSWTLGNIKKCCEVTTRKYYAILEKQLQESSKPYVFDPDQYLKGALMFKPARIGRKLIKMHDLLENLSRIDPIFIEQEKERKGKRQERKRERKK